jgi:aldehyde dehydrogenase (NAD+)
MFDAASGFGGYRQSGFGREGGREGLREYLEPAWLRKAPLLRQGAQPGGGEPGAAASLATSGPDPAAAASATDPAARAAPGPAGLPIDHGDGPPIDRTVKLYIGGKQVRPDSGYSMECRSSKGVLLGEVPLGNRKDIRNAVEAAGGAQKWGSATAHNRAQVLYYLAENLSQRAAELVTRLATVVGRRQASKELKLSVERLFSYAAWADKYEGAVHSPPFRNI